MDEVAGCYLEHERLAIIDPTSGDQPLFNKAKNVVVAVSPWRRHVVYKFFPQLSEQRWNSTFSFPKQCIGLCLAGHGR